MRAEAKRRAFTFIELLVVVAIIAILAGILLPTLSRAKASGQSVRCKANEKQMGAALVMYLGDTSVFPYTAYLTSQLPKGACYWFDALSPYLGGTRWAEGVYRCPTFKSSWRAWEGAGAPPSSYGNALGAYAY